MFDLIKLEQRTGVSFKNAELCKEAFTHKSFAAEHNLKYDNQRLEFLGDAVVQIVLTDEIYKRYPDVQEGTLTKMRSALVNQEALAAFARDLQLGEFLMQGHGEQAQHGEDRESTISDLFEAFIGAIYLDSGLEVAKNFFLKELYKLHPEPRDALVSLNPKGALQEWTQHLGRGVPDYKLVSVTGPGHNLVYEVELAIDGYPPVRAKATNRRLAEVEAARILLTKIDIKL